MDIEIVLSSREFFYLKNSSFLPKLLSAVVDGAVGSNDNHLLIVPSELIEPFRSAFTERLAARGFDEEYDVTAEGKVLEELIDKFYQTNRMP